MDNAIAEAKEVALLELLDRVVDHGVVLAGDITISVADVDLIYLGLRVMLTSVEGVEELRRRGPTLPVRFGTVVADVGTLARALAERHGELAADLARLGDKVEFGLAVLWERPPVDDAGGPRDD